MCCACSAGMGSPQKCTGSERRGSVSYQWHDAQPGWLALGGLWGKAPSDAAGKCDQAGIPKCAIADGLRHRVTGLG
jgi:hypothetical protein